MVVVTGSSGLIGSYLSIKSPRANLASPDLSGVACVVHLAQSNRYKDPDGDEDVWNVNANGTFNLLQEARRAGVKRFIYAATGTAGGVYGASKQAAESLCLAFGKHFSVAVLKFYSVYGEGQRHDAFVPSLVERVRLGKPVYNGIETRPLYAGDAAMAICRAIEDNIEGVRTVSGPEILTAHEMALIIGEKLGIEPILSHGAPERIHRVSDFSCPTRFEEGVDDYLYGDAVRREGRSFLLEEYFHA